MPKNDNTFHAEQLPNGLRMVFQQHSSSPSVAVVVLVGVGSRNENENNNGISHFLEHMAFKGTTRRPTTMDIAAEVDNVGGESNAFTSKEYTGYYIKVAAKEIDLAIDLLQDMLFHSLYQQQESDRERNVIIEEINMYRDSPRDVVGEMYEKLLFPEQPLGMEVTGTPESLSHIGHAELKGYNQHWYIPNNMVIGVTGQFDEVSVKQKLDQAFSNRQQHKVDGYTKAHYNQSGPGIVVRQKDIDQTQLIVGWRSYALDHPNRYALGLLNVVLGGNMSSRLFTQVREKRGLAYAVHSSVDDYMDTGSINCQAGLGHQNIKQALEVILDQFVDVRDHGITEIELTRAKQYLRGRLALSMEDGLSTALFHSRQWLLENKIRTVDEILQEVDKVELAQIQHVARELFVARGLNVAAIGPQVDKNELKHLLDV